MLDCAPRNLLSEVDHQGFAMVAQVIAHDELDELGSEIERLPAASEVRRRGGTTFAIRNALGMLPSAAQLANHPAITSLIARVLGDGAHVTRSILFDKNPEANWAVPWHQDTTVAVRKRIEVAGFGPWSVKAGLPHVQPPREILERMLTLRLHLDDSDSSNGALRVLPGSHVHGLLDSEQVESWKSRVSPVTCEVAAGGALLMRPLILHASSPADAPRHRRVLHLEFSAQPLPGALTWCDHA